MLKRRSFLQSVALASGAAALARPASLIHAAPAEYLGRLLVVMQLDGGWDVTSLCDPKVNTPGERDINNWANQADIQTAGRINYAPFASNQRLFESHFAKMLVVNGVDAQTNSHTTGVLHNWSGRNAAGLPSLTALFAAANAPDMPLAYVNYGGFADTASLLRYSRLDDYRALTELLNPITVPWDASRNIASAASISRVQRYQQAAVERKLAKDTLTPRQRENLEAYLSARSTRDTLRNLLQILPPEENIQSDGILPGTNFYTSLMRQIQLTLLTFKSGVGLASDLMLSGFDTHNLHDSQHTALYNHVAEAIDYFWNYAGELGISDRITLVIGSDFGRTPNYNAQQGKDHWPIGSYIVMEEQPIWGNRVVGVTDELHNVLKIDPVTLQRDDANGIVLYPKHVHKALRRHLGLENFAAAKQLTFGPTEDVDLFAPDKWT
jgi:hypothetical protein